MAHRSADTHATFFLPHLKPSLDLLDVGCGPGTITVGLAQLVAPGTVTAVDANPSQAEMAERALRAAGLTDVRALTARADALPLDDDCVDLVFSHALLEHVPDPAVVLREARRVLRPGGVLGVCSPDWSGFLLAPYPEEVAAAVQAYTALQHANGGDTEIGHQLGELLHRAGFTDVHVDARYERYADASQIAGYLAEQLDAAGAETHAAVLRGWGNQPRTMFAQAWVSAVGRN